LTAKHQKVERGEWSIQFYVFPPKDKTRARNQHFFKQIIKNALLMTTLAEHTACRWLSAPQVKIIQKFEKISECDLQRSKTVKLKSTQNTCVHKSNS
jgi:hypothetical protein